MKWQPELALGIPAIDEQHKMLIQMLEDIYDACSRGEGLKYITDASAFLEWYVHKHFKDEEYIQKKYGYPRYRQHQKIHHMYIKELNQLLIEMKEVDMTTEHIAKVVAYLNKMIKDHMQGEDKMLAHYLRHHELYREEKKEKNYERSEMTNLLTRKALEGVVQEKLEDDKDFVFAILQLDGFSDVNRTYGYEIGNEVLIYVSGILQQYESEQCIIAHTYQNEFMLLIDMPDRELTSSMLGKIQKKVYDGFKRKGSIIPLAINIGIVEVVEEKNISNVIQKANIALGVAKNSGKNTIIYYDEQMHTEIMRRLSIINQLQPHSLSQCLRVVYQPIYNLKTGKVKGCEALLRMIDGDGNMISPMEFIPIAEQNHLITDVGYFCMNEVCKTFKNMKCMHEELKYISVNLSVQQLEDTELVERMGRIAKSHGIELKNIYFELTESAIIENIEQVQKAIQAFKEKESKILLDDFGTGYSALSYLSQLDIDIIKIDKSFLNHIDTNPKTMMVLRNIIKLLQELNLEIVVEGVETKEELETLRGLGADNIQGYYISRPISEKELCACITQTEGIKTLK